MFLETANHMQNIQQSKTATAMPIDENFRSYIVCVDLVWSRAVFKYGNFLLSERIALLL